MTFEMVYDEKNYNVFGTNYGIVTNSSQFILMLSCLVQSFWFLSFITFLFFNFELNDYLEIEISCWKFPEFSYQFT